jgi:hypothetical protein
VEGFHDDRQDPRISTASCFFASFFMFVHGERSLLAFDQRWRREDRRARWRKVFKSPPPSDDAMAYCYERFHLEELRQLLHHLYTTLQRNHVLDQFTLEGFRAAALDGHELFASYDRHCPECLTRTVDTKQGPKTQYYHSIVLAQIVGGPFALPLDLEPLRPGENEIAPALRLLTRLCQNYPKAFDLITGDGMYANPQILRFLRAHHKHLLAVLKDNHPDLLADAKALFAEQQPLESTEGKTELERWDIDGFTTWPQATETVRVVRSRETKPAKAGLTLHDWFWVTTCGQQQAPTNRVCRFGHKRWDVENLAFNYLVNYLHFDHCFHHHPTAITAFALTDLIAYLLLQAFYFLNLKPQLQRQLSLLSSIHELAADFWANLLPLDSS